MKIIYIIYYTVLESLRDRKSLFQMLVFPVVLMFVLGSALGAAFEPSQYGKTTVAYLNLDTGIGGSSFDSYLALEEIQAVLNIKKVTSLGEGIKLVEDREATSLIYIDENYSENLSRNEGAEIQLFYGSFSSYRKTTVNIIVEGYTSSANSVIAAMRMGEGPKNYEHSKSVNNVPISTKGKTPTAIDYYSVTMLAMIIMYGANYGIYGVGKEEFDSVGNRIRSAPIRPYEIYIGKTLGIVATLFLQAIILVIFTWLVYKVNWGNLGVILLICFTLCTLSTALGVMISSLSPSQRTASSIISILVPIFTFVSGGYIKLPESNQLFSKLKLISPNHLAQTAMFNQMFGGAKGELQLQLLIMWAMIGVFFLGAVMVGRRRVQ